MFTSKTAAKRNSRKTFEKLLREFKKDASFKLPKTITTLVIDTKTIINHLSIADVWKMDADSQLEKTLERIAYDGNDPLDKAFYALAPHTSRHGPMLTLPFNKTFGISGNVWHYGDIYELAVKGTPEHMLTMCDLTENEREAAERKLHQLAGNGGRVVALAHATLHHNISSFSDLTKKDSLVFDGLVSLSQYISPQVKTLVKAAQNADIVVYLLTGDHLESALHIAKELGIATHGNYVLDSRKMHVMTDEEAAAAVHENRVFSRLTPQKRAHIIGRFNKSEYILLDS